MFPCIWLILAFTGQSRSMVVVLVPRMVSRFKFYTYWTSLLEIFVSKYTIAFQAGCLISVFQWDLIKMEPPVQHTFIVTSVFVNAFSIFDFH